MYEDYSQRNSQFSTGAIMVINIYSKSTIKTLRKTNEMCSNVFIADSENILPSRNLHVQYKQ